MFFLQEVGAQTATSEGSHVRCHGFFDSQEASKRRFGQAVVADPNFVHSSHLLSGRLVAAAPSTAMGFWLVGWLVGHCYRV